MPATRTPSRPPASAAPVRPVLSAREAQALRDALALRQLVAAGETLTPAQLTALRTATAVATRTTGTAAARRRRPRPGPQAGRPHEGRPARQGRRAPRSRRTGSSWSTRLGVVAMSTLLLPAAASLVLSGGQDGRPGRRRARRHRASR